MISLLIFKMMIVRLVLTIIIEISVAQLFKVNSKKDILNILLVNVLTNPLLVIGTFVIKLYYGQTIYNISLFLAEILVFVVEGAIYKAVLQNKRVSPYLLSLTLNLVSFLSGFILLILHI